MVLGISSVSGGHYKNYYFFNRAFHINKLAFFSTNRKARPIDSSFASILDDVKRLLRTGDSGNNAGITWAFSSSIICMLCDEILKIFHQL